MPTTTSTAPRAYAGIPLLWTLVILWLTLTPAREMPRTPEWELLSFDTAAHAFVFAVLAFTAYISASRQQRFPALRQYAPVLVAAWCTLFGALIEVLQVAMQQGRHGEWSDLLSDTIGTLAGLGAARLIRQWWAA